MVFANKVYKRTTLISVCLVAVLVGIALARQSSSSLDYAWLGLAVVFVLTTFKRKTTTHLLAIMFFGFVIGMLRGGTFLQKLAPYQQLAGQKVTIMVTADTGAYYNKTKQLEFEGSHVVVVSPYYKKLPGKMVISGFGENSVLRGDTLLVNGKLHTRRGGKQAGISFGTLQVTSRSASILEKVRRDFLAGLATALPEPNDQFAAGLLVGQKSDLPEDVTATIRTVGLSHIIAVSGYNLTILAEVARRRLGRKSKFRSTALSIILVVIFIILAGSSASIARAALVSILGILTAYYGRRIKPHLLILIAAAITGFMNPINIWADIGWYLSFLAFFGVLILAPAVTKRVFKEKTPSGIWRILIETSAAQFMTLPIILYIFGNISLVALIANVLVVPFVPLAMLLGLFAGIAGMILPAVASIIALPARLLLDFMLGAAQLVSRLPYASVERKIDAMQLAIIYTVIIVVVLVMKKKTPEPDILTE